MNYILDKQTVIAADLDGTLTESKSVMSQDMAHALSSWLSTNRFAVISGGSIHQFKRQFIEMLPATAPLQNLYLFPSNGAVCFAFQNGEWKAIYEDPMPQEEKDIISRAIHEAVLLSGVVIEETFGDQLDYPSGEVTFSALGQQAPYEKKIVWDKDQTKRKRIVAHLAPLLPNFSISIGGTTSINITRSGIDKAYAILKVKELLSVDNAHIVFLGDALFEGGNDWAVISTGVACVKINDPKEAIAFINQNIAAR